MRKRSIISIILVLIFLGLSHNIWLTIKPKPMVSVFASPGGGGACLNRIK